MEAQGLRIASGYLVAARAKRFLCYSSARLPVASASRSRLVCFEEACTELTEGTVGKDLKKFLKKQGPRACGVRKPGLSPHRKRLASLVCWRDTFPRSIVDAGLTENLVVPVSGL